MTPVLYASSEKLFDNNGIGMLSSAEDETVYIASVADALTRAESERELSEIRNELYSCGYAGRGKGTVEKKQTTPSYLTFKN